jgi:hypothetical protein
MHKVDACELSAEYSRADLAHYGYVPPIIEEAPLQSSEFNETWTSLGSMIDWGERLVLFVNCLDVDKHIAPYLLDEFSFV